MAEKIDTDRELMITCNTLRTEIEHVCAEHGVERRIVWLESQLHNVTSKLSAALQEAIDSVEDADRVILGFGNCGNVVQGLISGDFELIIPRLDDCISLIFGSQKRREAYSQANHALYFTDGWMDEGHSLIDEYEHACEKFDEETACEIFNMMYEHYETMCYLDTGLYDVDALMDQTRFIGEMCGLVQKSEPGTLAYVEELVCGPWDESRFVHVPPHGIVPSAPFKEPGSI